MLLTSHKLGPIYHSTTGTTERNFNMIVSPAPRAIINCVGCGAVVPAEFENCRAMFNSVLAREYSEPRYGESHLFTVDAYALQHSEEHGPRSNAFHLLRLCWLLEHDGNPSIRQVRAGSRAFYAAREKSYRAFPFLAPPAHRGALTVQSVLCVASPQEQPTQARAWGESVWNAWSAHHAWARKEVQRFFRPG